MKVTIELELTEEQVKVLQQKDAEEIVREHLVNLGYMEEQLEEEVGVKDECIRPMMQSFTDQLFTQINR